MQPYDLKILGERLGELAEVFDRKPMSEKALGVWFSVLRDFTTDKVCAVLISWPRTHTKFPSPAEAWKALNEIAIDRREAEAQELKQETPWMRSEAGKAAIEKMRALFRRVPNREPGED